MTGVASPQARPWRWLILLLPVVITGLVLASQPPDQLGVAGENPLHTRLYYDDADLAAFALRGLNASLGRHAGAEEPPLGYEPFAEALRQGDDLPLKERYFLEYPHAALFLFRGVVAATNQEKSWPAVLLDAHHTNLFFHKPANERERWLWQQLRRAARVFVLIHLAALLLMMVVLLRGLGPQGAWAGPAWLLALPAALYFTLGRYDVLPSLCVLLSLAAATRQRPLASGFCLALATALKLYPLLLAPLIGRWITHHLHLRAGLRWAAAYLTPLALILVIAAATDGIQGAIAPLRYQLHRPLEPAWVLYGRLLPLELAESKARNLILLLPTILFFILPPGDLGSLLRRSAFLLLLSATLQPFFSPQWLLWFVPLIVPLARQSWFVLLWAVAFDIITYLSFPVVFDHGPEWAKETLIILRGVMSAAMLLWLAGWEFVYIVRTYLTLPPPSTEPLRSDGNGANTDRG